MVWANKILKCTHAQFVCTHCCSYDTISFKKEWINVHIYIFWASWLVSKYDFMSHNYCIIQTVSSNGWTAVKSHTHDLWHSTLTLFNVYDVIIKFTTKPFEYPVIMIIQWKNLADFLSANFFLCKYKPFD